MHPLVEYLEHVDVLTFPLIYANPKAWVKTLF